MQHKYLIRVLWCEVRSKSEDNDKMLVLVEASLTRLRTVTWMPRPCSSTLSQSRVKVGHDGGKTMPESGHTVYGSGKVHGGLLTCTSSRLSSV